MIAYTLHAKISKRGYLNLRNLPLDKGDEVDIIILKKKKIKDIESLITNDHVWSPEDIKAVEKGREIVNQWKISS